MAFYYNLPQQPQHPTSNAAPSHNHHGRSRRGPRLPAQGARQFRGVRSMKELTEAPAYSAFRARFEACKGFELDDDLEFCPGLLTEDDVGATTPYTSPSTNPIQLQSSVSSLSDRSSNSSGSPSSSPLQQQVHPQQVSPPFSLAPSFQPAPAFAAAPPSASLKIHQPAAVRSHKAIPIVNPSTGMRVASPPSSVSPGRMQQQTYRRW